MSTNTSNITDRLAFTRGANVVEVWTADDIAPASGGVRSVTEDTVFIIKDDITTSDAFEYADGIRVCFLGDAVFNHTITYTGSAVLHIEAASSAVELFYCRRIVPRSPVRAWRECPWPVAPTAPCAS